VDLVKKKQIARQTPPWIRKKISTRRKERLSRKKSKILIVFLFEQRQVRTFDPFKNKEKAGITRLLKLFLF